MHRTFFYKLAKKLYPKNHKIGSWVVTKVNIKYESKWIALAELGLKNKDKNISYGVLITKPSVAILAVKDKKVVLVRQPRFGGRTNNWELPQEVAENENLKSGAIRGAREEFGLVSYEKIEKLPFNIHALPARVTEQNYAFLIKVKEYNFKKRLDKEEVEKVKLATVKEVANLIAKRKITDGVTLAILHWFILNHNKI